MEINGGDKHGNGEREWVWRIVLPTSFLAACWTVAVCAVLATGWLLSR